MSRLTRKIKKESFKKLKIFKRWVLMFLKKILSRLEKDNFSKDEKTKMKSLCSIMRKLRPEYAFSRQPRNTIFRD